LEYYDIIMKRICLTLLLIRFSLLYFNAQQISVTPIILNSQLPSNSVQRIFQDKDGFMWFGTLDGLCRYDGYRMLIFKSGFNTPNLLTDNEITALAEDHNNNIWIGTKRGLNILNRETYNISHFSNSQIQESEIKIICITSDKTIWVGTQTSIYRYNRDLSFLKKYDESIPSMSINHIYEDSKGNIWATVWGEGLYKYDKEKDTFVRFPTIDKKNNPFRIFEDHTGQLWIGTWGDGLFLFYPHKEEKNMYVKLPTYNKDKKIEETTFFSMAYDKKNNYIWAMSFSGIFAFKYNKGTLYPESVDITDLFRNYNNIFSEIIRDKTGNLWIGTFSEGILCINFDKPFIQNYGMSSIKSQIGIATNLTALYKNDNEIWFNQNRYGLGIYDINNKKVKLYNNLNNIDLSNIACINGFRAYPEEVWLGASNSPMIYRMKKENEEPVIYKTNDLTEIITNPGHPQLFHEDKKNNVWIVTKSNVFIKPHDRDTIINVEFSFNNITGLTEDIKGNIWISTLNEGIFQLPITGNLVLDESKIKNYNYDTANQRSNITCICADNSGKIRVGTKEGNIIVYNTLTGIQTDITRSVKLTGDGILNIIDDDFGNIWISTNKKIIVYNPENEASRTFTQVDGVMVNSFLSNSYNKDKNGNILFGGNKGLSIFNLSGELSEHPSENKIFISDVKINNQSILQGSNDNRFKFNEQYLELKPEDKNIEFDFSSLNYTFPTKIRYAYKMEGLDDEWIYTDEGRQFAIYNQLKKGMHKFIIKATDENGLWDNKETVLKIYKHPAFYETTRAYMVYAILIILIAYYAITRAKRRIKLINQLKIAQIEKNKSEELTQTKLRYFTNISHDFLTPLTIISCLIDDAEIAYKGKIKHFDSIRLNLSRLRRLLQQVLDFRKIESGNMKLKISYGDISGFIKDLCYNHFLVLMKKKNISFSFSSSPNQIQAYFDADKVDKIVFNLLSNAFKYTPENGEVKIELESYKKDKNEFLRLKISDTGIGISPDDLKDIFTRFYNNRMKEAGETNGIGLSLTKELVEIHHGDIHVDSKKNTGTIFIIELPINRESYNESELGISDQTTLPVKGVEWVSVPDEDESLKSRVEPSKTAILLVEDNEELLILMKDILSKHYNVVTAINGIDAQDRLKNQEIDIIVSDVMMPELDGLSLCRILKNDLETSHIPVILLTAKNSTEDRIECYNAGADAYIAKPFDLKVLEARINNFLANKKNKQKEFKGDPEINISKLEYPSLDEQFLNNTINIIEDNLSKGDFDVVVLANKLNMSKSSLYRKMKAMTDLSPRDFIRNIRLKHACALLKDKSISISEVAYMVGFSDPKYFTACFRQEFNITPRDYQKQQQETPIKL